MLHLFSGFLENPLNPMVRPGSESGVSMQVFRVWERQSAKVAGLLLAGMPFGVVG